MNFDDRQIQAPHPPFPVDHAHPWHKGSKVGSKEMDLAVLSPGIPGAHAGFGEPTASVDNTVGTPSVEISASGPNQAKVFDFAFHNLKGDKGDPFVFDDFSQEQLNDLRANIVGLSVLRYRLEYSDFTQSSGSSYHNFFATDFPQNTIIEATSPPEAPEPNFVFLCFKNGLILQETEDYELRTIVASILGTPQRYEISHQLRFNDGDHPQPVQGDIYDIIVIKLSEPESQEE